MSGAEGEHASYQALLGWIEGALTADERERLAAHLECCDTCAASLDELRELGRTLDGITPPGGVAALRPGTPARRAAGRRVGPWLAAAAALIAAIVWLRGGVRTRVVPTAASSAPVQPAPPPAQPQPLLALALRDTGGELGLTPDGTLMGLAGLTAEERHVLAETLAQGRLPAPADLEALVGAGGTLLSRDRPAAELTLQAPVGTAVAEPRPSFRWQTLAGATGYEVCVFDADSFEVARSPRLRGTLWRPERALAAGRLYTWRLTALRPGEELRAPLPPLPAARFRVLSAAEGRALRAARERAGGSHLALAALHARAGLFDEAEVDLQRLQAANPQAPVAAALRHSLAVLRRGVR